MMNLNFHHMALASVSFYLMWLIRGQFSCTFKSPLAGHPSKSSVTGLSYALLENIPEIDHLCFPSTMSFWSRLDDSNFAR